MSKNFGEAVKCEMLIKRWRNHAKTLRANACKSKSTHKCGQAVFRNKSYGMASMLEQCANQLEQLK